MAEKCTACGLCQKECAFLKKYGKPREIAESYEPDRDFAMAFECSLCNLCTAVCPFKINPAGMFLTMRRCGETRCNGARENSPSTRLSGTMKNRGFHPASVTTACPVIVTPFFPRLRSALHPARQGHQALHPPAAIHPDPGDCPGLLHQAIP
jgi:Fe-S oxidoreductase